MYDAIVIGAGVGGLMAALTMQEKGAHVLIIEQGKNVGGVATSFTRGRFEFEVSLRGMIGYDIKSSRGTLYHLLKRHGIELQVSSSKELYTLISVIENKKYTLPLGMENYITKMEEYVPGSKPSMKAFFYFVREVNQALNYLEESHMKADLKVLNREFKNYMAVAPYSLDKILKNLHMPPKAIQILESYALYLGSPATELSFVHYAYAMQSFIQNGFTIPNHTSYDLTSQLLEKYLEAGGKLLLESKVKNIIVEKNKVKGVILNNGTRFKTHHIISNISPRMVFERMIPNEEIPKKAIQLENMRILGARSICIYLGLNKSAKELKLDSYMYVIYKTLDSSQEFKRMQTVFSGDFVATVYNNACPTYSPKGTCILELSSLIYSDEFTKMIKKDQYLEFKNQIAQFFITEFENATGVDITNSIEEIEVATPLTFERYINHPDGVILGYMPYKEDNLLPRRMNSKKEYFIKGLRFCGGFGARMSGITSSLISGEEEALSTLKEMRL